MRRRKRSRCTQLYPCGEKRQHVSHKCSNLWGDCIEVFTMYQMEQCSYDCPWLSYYHSRKVDCWCHSWAMCFSLMDDSLNLGCDVNPKWHVKPMSIDFGRLPPPQRSDRLLLRWDTPNQTAWTGSSMASSEGLQTSHQPDKPQYRERIRTQILAWFVIKPEYSWTFISYLDVSCASLSPKVYGGQVRTEKHHGVGEAAKESTSQPTNKQQKNPTTNQSPSTRSYATSTPVSWGNKQGHLSTTLDTAPGSWPHLTGCFESESLVITHMFRCLATTRTLPPLDYIALLIHKTGFIIGRIGMTRQIPSYAHSKLGSLVW